MQRLDRIYEYYERLLQYADDIADHHKGALKIICWLKSGFPMHDAVRLLVALDRTGLRGEEIHNLFTGQCQSKKRLFDALLRSVNSGMIDPEQVRDLYEGRFKINLEFLANLLEVPAEDVEHEQKTNRCIKQIKTGDKFMLPSFE